MWFPCTETYWWSAHLHLHLSFTDVDIFLCCKCSRISILFLTIYWCWLFFMCKMFLSFSTDVYVIFLYWNTSMKCMHFIFICHLLMLTYFCVVNVPEFAILFLIIYWCWLFLICKCSHHFRLMFMWFPCTETYWWSAHLHLHLSFTDVDIFLCCKCSRISIFLTIFCSHHFQLMFIDFLVLKHINEVHTFIFICHLLMLTFFCGKYSRISIVFLIIYWCWLFFMCKMFLSFLSDVYVIFLLKHINGVHTLHLHLSFIDVDIFLCWKCPTISILFLIIYWCWFFMCKMFLSFSTDVYVIFLYWNTSMKCMHFIFICHLLMLTYFCVVNVPEFA